MHNDAPLSASVLEDDILEAIAAHGGVRTFPAHSVLITLMVA